MTNEPNAVSLYLGAASAYAQKPYDSEGVQFALASVSKFLNEGDAETRLGRMVYDLMASAGLGGALLQIAETMSGGLVSLEDIISLTVQAHESQQDES